MPYNMSTKYINIVTKEHKNMLAKQQEIKKKITSKSYREQHRNKRDNNKISFKEFMNHKNFKPGTVFIQSGNWGCVIIINEKANGVYIPMKSRNAIKHIPKEDMYHLHFKSENFYIIEKHKVKPYKLKQY